MGRRGLIAARRGRGEIGPLVLLVPLLFLGLLLVHLIRNPPGSLRLLGSGTDPREATAGEGARVAILSGTIRIEGEGGGEEISLRLSPLEALDGDPPGRTAAVLQEELGLPAGEPWRLELTFGSTPKEQAEERAGINLGAVEVRDGEGTALGWIGSLARMEARSPLARLFSGGPEGGEAPGQLVLWGRRPGESARIVLGELGSSELEPGEVEPGELPRHFVHIPTSGGETPGSESGDERDREIARLNAELKAERSRRHERELQWYRYNETLGSLGLEGLAGSFPVDLEALPEEARKRVIGWQERAGAGEPKGDGADGEGQPEESREHEIRRSLGALLALGGVHSIDPLEVGALGEGWIGPAVFRLLDERGRLAGGLYAERLRLEASRSARSVTLVLEEGYESRAGEREAFSDGMRKIVLPFVDPGAWVDSMPELFGADDLAPAYDDGLWDLEALRGRLNELLREDAATGWYRLRGLGGVRGDELVDVHLEAFDADGRIERRLFADRMRIEALSPGSPGVGLELRDGAIVRGDEKAPFVGEIYRVFLPRARVEAWRRAGVPGLSSPPSTPDGSSD